MRGEGLCFGGRLGLGVFGAGDIGRWGCEIERFLVGGVLGRVLYWVFVGVMGPSLVWLCGGLLEK